MSGGKRARAFAIGVSAVVALCGIFGDDPAGASPIPTPAPADRDATVAELVRAADAQDICYGWQLSDGAGVVVSQGSNFGAEVAVNSGPRRCPRWIELRVTVVWTPESSESKDSATRKLGGSADLAEVLTDEAALDRVGLTQDALIEDPANAVLLGVLAIPLLVAERGLAPAVPARTSAATPDPAALTDPGSDFWRDRGESAVIAIGLMVVAGGVFSVGWRATRRSVKVEQARRLKLGDLVDIGGQTWTVCGSIRFDEGTWSWAKHLLDDADGARRWLSVEEGPDVVLTLWTEVPGATVRPGKNTVDFDGRRYRLEGKGKARYTASGTTGLDPTGSMRYRDYEAADGARLSLEAYGDSKRWDVARGERLHRSELTIHPQVS